MADVILRIISEGATEATDGIGSVAKSYDTLSKKSKEASTTQTQGYKEASIAAEKANKIIGDSKPAVNISKQKTELQKLKQEIKDLTNEAIKAGQGTTKFNQALAEAGRRKADLKDLQQAISLLDPDVKAKAFLNLSQTIISGFAAGQGALQAFGLSSEDATRSLVKLQSLMAFGQFIGQLGEIGDTFAVIKTQIQNSEIAMKAFNLVARANPFALLATAAAAVTTAVIAFSQENDNAAESLERIKLKVDGLSESLGNKLLKQFGRQSEAIQDEITQIEDLINQNNRVLSKTEEDAKKKEQIQEDLNKRLSDLQAQQSALNLTRFNQEIEDRISAAKEGGKQSLNVLKQQLEAEQLELKRQVQAGEAGIFESAQIRNDAFNKAIKDINAIQESIDKSEVENNKKKNEEKAKQNKEYIEKQKKEAEDLANLELTFQKKQDELIQKQNQEFIKRDEEQIKEQDEKRLEAALDANRQINEGKLAQENELQSLIAIYRAEAEKSEFDQRIAALQAKRDFEIQNAEETGKKITEIEQEYSDARVKIIIDEANRKIALADTFAGALSSIARSLARVDEDYAEFQKAVALFQIAVDTAKAVSAAIEKATRSSSDTYTMIANIAVGVAAVTAAVAQAYTILDSEPTPRAGFREGGYTGHGSEYDEAGVVHKEEFVFTKDKTRKHRNLFEAIHNDNFNKVTQVDIEKLLAGTGVTVSKDVPEKMIRVYEVNDKKQVILRGENDKVLREINANLKKYFEAQGNKPTKEILPDGTQIIKSGNTTRIIRKRKL